MSGLWRAQTLSSSSEFCDPCSLGTPGGKNRKLNVASVIQSRSASQAELGPQRPAARLARGVSAQGTALLLGH